MENVIKLHFQVGELAEARSFQCGYRELKWTKLYQQVPPLHVGKAKEKHRELMLRPCYPPIHNKNQMPQVSEISEVAVIVDDSWKVGDLVDWWTTDCYWSGRITKLLGDDKAEIELHPPPRGEGSSYEVHLKDLRPSLDWSPQCGWTVPNQEGDTGRACAQLIKPVNQGSLPKPLIELSEAQMSISKFSLMFESWLSLAYLESLAILAWPFLLGLLFRQICLSVAVIGGLQIMDTDNEGQETEAGIGLADSSVGLSSSSNSIAVSDEVKSTGTTETRKRSFGTRVSEQVNDIQEKGVSLGCGDTRTRKTSLADSDSGRTSAEPAAEVAEKDLNSSSP
ncbi:UNVERIFIED_CONTAM: hypothetical protein Slati_1045700 [Sesamum latifolium]|uniref:Agenet domain-containing protein n=1 Tax=Sesamum latifolium TaxID=2727402 RepID=A0AAW2XZ07_9LAMI